MYVKSLPSSLRGPKLSQLIQQLLALGREQNRAPFGVPRKEVVTWSDGVFLTSINSWSSHTSCCVTRIPTVNTLSGGDEPHVWSHFYPTTRHDFPEDGHLNFRRRENPRSGSKWVLFLCTRDDTDSDAVVTIIAHSNLLGWKTKM
jgi:hypothetical protein